VIALWYRFSSTGITAAMHFGVISGGGRFFPLPVTLITNPTVYYSQTSIAW